MPWSATADDWRAASPQYVPMDIDEFNLGYYEALSEENSTSVVSRLPPELLSRVFWEVIRSVQLEDHSRQVLAITHVCAHWRAVAIRYQALWTRIYIPCRPGFLAATLQRSGQSLLRVFIPSFQEYRGRLKLNSEERDILRLKNTQRVLQELYRIRLLRLTSVDEQHLLRLSKDVISHETLRLHTLTLAVDNKTPRSLMHDLFRSPRLTDCVIIGGHPLLWDELSTCRNLKLEAFRQVQRHITTSLRTLQRCLQNFQSLRILHMVVSIP